MLSDVRLHQCSAIHVDERDDSHPNGQHEADLGRRPSALPGSWTKSIFQVLESMEHCSTVQIYVPQVGQLRVFLATWQNS